MSWRPTPKMRNGSKKARETASRKRRQKDQLTSGSEKKARAAVGSDNQLFRGKKNCLQFTL